MMKKDLTNSQLDRQNILNNNMALEEIRNTSNIQGVWFEDKVYFTKNMVAEFFEVDIRTIERCVSANLPELEKNGYVCRIRPEDGLAHFEVRAEQL